MSILILSFLSVIHASEVKLQCHLTEKKNGTIDSNNLVMPVPPVEMTSFNLSIADTVLIVDFHDSDLIHLNLTHQREGTLLEGDYDLKNADTSGLLMAGEHILSEGEKIQLKCFLSSIWTHPISSQKLSLINDVLLQRITRTEHILDVLDVNMDHYRTRKNRFLIAFSSFMALELLQVAFLLTTDFEMMKVLTPVSGVLVGAYGIRSLIVNRKRVAQDKEERSIINNKIREMRNILLGLRDDITLFMSDLESELKEDAFSSAQVMRKVEMFNKRIGQTLNMKIIMEIPRLLSRLSNQNPKNDLQYLLPSIDREESFVNDKIHRIIFSENTSGMLRDDSCESELVQLAETIHDDIDTKREEVGESALAQLREWKRLTDNVDYKEGIEVGPSEMDETFTSRERADYTDALFSHIPPEKRTPDMVRDFLLMKRNIPRKTNPSMVKRLRHEIREILKHMGSYFLDDWYALTGKGKGKDVEKIEDRVKRIAQKCLFLPRRPPNP